MNIEKLKEAIELMKLLGDDGEAVDTVITPTSFIGKKVLIRAHLMGVQIGVVESISDGLINLKQSRKFWRWQCRQGIALESFAVYGPSDGTRATAIVSDVSLQMSDCVGIISLTDAIFEDLNNWPTSEQD